ncbi:MAG: hypothetical protein U5N10_01770 [Gemmobacter sp.]|nr:hypothetical protein [Gemmobacter sp.]
MAARRLRPGGWLTIITGADALPELLAALAASWGQPRVLPLAAARGPPGEAGDPAARAKAGGRPFRLLAPFVLHQGASHLGDREAYTPEANEILRNGCALSAQFG